MAMALNPNYASIGNLSDSELMILAHNCGLEIQVVLNPTQCIPAKPSVCTVYWIAKSHWVGQFKVLGRKWYFDPAGQPAAFPRAGIELNIALQSNTSVMCGNLVILVFFIVQKHILEIAKNPKLHLPKFEDDERARLYLVELIDRFLYTCPPQTRVQNHTFLNANDMIASLFTVDYKGGEEWHVNKKVTNYMAVLAPDRHTSSCRKRNLFLSF